jgi:hypothetical protein
MIGTECKWDLSTIPVIGRGRKCIVLTSALTIFPHICCNILRAWAKRARTTTPKAALEVRLRMRSMNESARNG